MSQKEFSFSELQDADFYIDAVYKGGTVSNISSDPFHNLFPKCGNSGGFRKVLREDGSGKLAYVVLYTSMEELEWPDYLDEETGIFRYYGDNRTPGNGILNTKFKGNELLEKVFFSLHTNTNLEDIPPFFVFKKTGNGRDVKFLGLAVPGNPNISQDHDLIAFWRSTGSNRFQNYEAYFTILDTGSEPIQKQWVRKLISNHDEAMRTAPGVWRSFIQKGRNGIKPLKSKKTISIPSKYDQLQCDNEGRSCLNYIRSFYRDNPTGFELCAATLMGLSDDRYQDFSITRPWRDGGRDALGHYVIGINGSINNPLRIDCALEAKCYNENNGVGVKQMSRLISRIRYRQFGIMVTTSYVNKQAYAEVIEDMHPILIVSASDIAKILRARQITSGIVVDWMRELTLGRQC